ncbi:MAG: serine hydrolase, partial [Bacteroidota bacterium]
HYGGSGVYTTLSDLKKWLVNFQTKSFGGQAFYDLMHQTMKFQHDKTNDAFGLALGDFNGHEIVWYEGGDWGFSNYLMRFPKNNLTVVVMSNLGTGNARQYVNQVVDILTEDKVVQLK